MKMQRIISVSALAALTIIASALVWRFSLDSQYLAEAVAVAPPHIDESTNTLKQISDALVIAKRDNKRVLLQFGSRGCTWCHLLHNLFEKDERITAELKSDYVVVMVDVSDGNNKGVDDRYGNPIRGGLPVTVFLDSDGKQLLTKNIAFADKDALSHGTARVVPDKVLDILKEWAPRKDDHAA
jgi:thiol:disulfide interchange protein